MSRFEKLNAWLEDHRARPLWIVDGPKDGSTLKGYYVDPGAHIIVYDMGEDGWELFLPAGGNINIEDTLADAEYQLQYITNGERP